MVEPNFYMNFLRAGQHLSDFFTCRDLKITDRKGDSGTVRLVAHCNDLSSLMNSAGSSKRGTRLELSLRGPKIKI